MIEDYAILKTRASLMRLELKQTASLSLLMETDLGEEAMIEAVKAIEMVIDALEETANQLEEEMPPPHEKSPYRLSEFVKVGGTI